MYKLNRAGQKFAQTYEGEYASAQNAARAVEDTIKTALRDTGIFIHLISGRAKTPDSVREKLRRKQYKNPIRRMKDLVGVRVIAYYSDSIDPIVERLKKEFVVDEKESIDKRKNLGSREFGYGSVHLITQLKKGQVLSEDLKFLKKHWFEIQVRSVLGHAWSEIEHEIVYKSGIEYPEAIKRRFGRLAGSLELLDDEFMSLRAEREKLIQTYYDEYRVSTDSRTIFDTARLSAFLRYTRPDSLGWHSDQQGGQALDDHQLELSCVEALQAVGLGTPRSLQVMLKSRRFHRALSTYASSQGIGSAQVSHLAVIIVAIAVKDAQTVKRHFPEIVYDPGIAALVERRTRRGSRR